MKKIGFIGAGNMGKAIISGIISSGITPAENVIVYDVYKPALTALADEFGIQVVTNESAVVENSDLIVLAVKPGMVSGVIEKIAPSVSDECVIVSIAAGISIEKLSEGLPKQSKIVRVMPNTPAMVGCGMSALSPNQYLTDEDCNFVKSVFDSFGKAEFVGEYLMDAVVGVSGSAPAYVYMFIEALADGAVYSGMPRQQAYQFAAQTVLGSAKMVLETGKHPGELKDAVTSPGGTTIEAVKSLEESGFRAAVIEAVVKAAEKNRNM